MPNELILVKARIYPPNSNIKLPLKDEDAYAWWHEKNSYAGEPEPRRQYDYEIIRFTFEPIRMPHSANHVDGVSWIDLEIREYGEDVFFKDDLPRLANIVRRTYDYERQQFVDFMVVYDVEVQSWGDEDETDFEIKARLVGKLDVDQLDTIVI